MLKRLNQIEIYKLERQTAMFPEDWLKAQLKDDARAILDRIRTFNDVGIKYYGIYMNEEEYQQLKELAK